jgi:hypothetical protein
MRHPQPGADTAGALRIAVAPRALTGRSTRRGPAPEDPMPGAQREPADFAAPLTPALCRVAPGAREDAIYVDV